MKHLVSLAFTVSFLSACGGDEAAPPQSSLADAAQPVTVVQPTGGKVASTANGLPEGATTTTNPFAAFDFKGGTVYPAKAAVSIGTVSVPVGASEAFVPIRINRQTPNTVIVRVMTRNGTGTLAGIEGRHFQKVATTVFFRPGDPLEQTVRVPLVNMDAGRSFDIILPEGVVGGGVINSSARVTAVVGAKAGVAKTGGFRKARTFAPSGALAYQLDPAKVTWSDAGSAEAWRTRLPHGRTQPGNAETGLYLDPGLHPTAMPPFAIENGEVVIRSQQLASPILHDNTYWHHGAAMLTGQRMPATQLQYGQYEWTAMMPNRRGGWPALWLLPTSGWPPEIDVYEGFGYGSGWNFSKNISGNIHGGANGKRSFTALMQVNAANAYGLSGFDTSYHRFAVDIAPDFITWFVDGKETYQTVNPFKGTTWFPLMNVAVKKTGDYTGGTAEMRVRSFAVWKVPG
ncbi:MAG: family 16 glycosylhydrolase [Erythrobacter sp.]|uniref:family 16 glycosylhydrolase n=1 Tax=Erythrobacter sp. TaxID=1042 RepID=UPI0025E7B5E7|nr:family 16 glycosylhydrolase [Erythrobacter sp.]MCL9999403.1 family 16 glycosylhydrolase [Erythrobacter sp.]